MANTTKKMLSTTEKAEAKAQAILKKQRRGSTKVRDTIGDRILLGFTTLVLILILVIVGYPVLYVISCSFSSDSALSRGAVLLFPVDFSLKSYEFVFQYDVVWQGYRNTIFYTVCGVPITMIAQTLCAYPLSKPTYQGRGFFMGVFFFTTLVSAGMVPNLLIRSQVLGLMNSVWAVLLAGVVSVHNMIILRTSFRSSIPGELYDAAAIDGASDFQTLTKIALPLCKATLSVLTLYSAVGCWNEYFTSMIYLPNRPDLHPLQLVLRPILTAAQTINQGDLSGTAAAALQNAGVEGVIFALIVITTAPVLVMYAVVQKYFEKGVMVGSVKG